MKTLSVFLAFLLASTAIPASTPRPTRITHRWPQTSRDSEVGIPAYPRAEDSPEATRRLMETKGETWLLARAYHTNDALKDVVKYFKEEAKRTNGLAANSPLTKELLHNNWKVSKVLPRFAPNIFGAGSEFKTLESAERPQISFGVIALDDSFVRVHLMSPYPSPGDNNKLASGTMIVLVRERVTQPAESASAETEKIYTGQEVTRKVRVKWKPEPEYVGLGPTRTVVLRAVFSGSGKVKQIRVVSGWPGYTEAAIKAARKISFEPAIKDGSYVSMWMELVYNFYP